MTRRREPEESYAPSSEEFPADNNATSTRPTEQKDQAPPAAAISGIDKKFREMELSQSEDTSASPGIRAGAFPGQDAMYGTSDGPGPHFAEGYRGMPLHQQQNRPHYMPQDLRSITQDPNMQQCGYGAPTTSGYHPTQSFPSSTVTSSYMNRPTPPSTATPPSTNPPQSGYEYRQNDRIARPQEQTRYVDHQQSQYRAASYGRDEQRYENPRCDNRYEDPHRDPRYDNPGRDPRYDDPRHMDPRYQDPRDTRYNNPYPPQSPYDDRYTQPQYGGPYDYSSPARQYAPPTTRQQANPWDAPPSYYDNYGQAAPTHFRSRFSTPPPAAAQPLNQITNIEGQLSKLDQDQLPVYIQRGPGADSSREPSIDTPSAHKEGSSQYSPQEEVKVRSGGDHPAPAPQPHRQNSHVKFPSSMISSTSSSSQDATTDLYGRSTSPGGGGQIDKLSRSASSSTDITLDNSQCSAAETTPQGNSSLNPLMRNSPVPSEHTDIISSPVQQPSHPSEMPSSPSTQRHPEHQDKQSMPLPPTASGNWNGERRSPIPSQHTDKLPMQNLPHEHSTTYGNQQSQQDSNPGVMDPALQCHSAPPELGMSMEDQLQSLSTMPRVATQMTEPLGEPVQGRT